MKVNYKNIVVGLVALSCILTSIVLVLKTNNNWGWFLFVGIAIISAWEKE
jgi:hypothetical protein